MLRLQFWLGAGFMLALVGAAFALYGLVTSPASLAWGITNTVMCLLWVATFYLVAWLDANE